MQHLGQPGEETTPSRRDLGPRRILSCIYICLEAEINKLPKTQTGSTKERYLSLEEQYTSQCASAFVLFNEGWETAHKIFSIGIHALCLLPFRSFRTVLRGHILD